MKFFWLFFSLLLSTLSVFPCGDSLECKTKTESKIPENTDHEKHNHESEQCTPFCSCACCGITVFQFQKLAYNFKTKTILYNQKNKIIFYSFIYKKQVAYKIWQPPKIS
jgi:hypothetical protein